MKWIKKTLAWGAALMMSVSMSVASSAAQQLPVGLFLAPTMPISLSQQQYQMDLKTAIVRHTKQTASFLSVSALQTLDPEQMVFYPGDTLYIPLLDGASGKAYAEKNLPSNWFFRSEGLGPQAVSNVRWANETGALTLAVDFADALPQADAVKVSGTILFYDQQNKVYNQPIVIAATFQNLTREVNPGVVNEIVSPMTLHAGKNYQGEAVTLSFGGDVLFQEAVLQEGSIVYLNLDRSFDSKIANRYRSFDIQCYHFMGDEDTFQKPGRVCLPAQRTDSYVYEVVDGALKQIQSSYDEEHNRICFTAESLGYYVVSPIIMA